VKARPGATGITVGVFAACRHATGRNSAAMRFSWLLLILLLLGRAHAAVEYGMSKAALIQELGKPTSVLARPGSGREILNYPNGVRIELEQGKVVSVKGLDIAAPAAEAVAPAVATEEEKPAAEAEAEPKLTPAQQKAEAEAMAKAEQEMAAADAKTRAEMEKAIAQLESIHDRDREPEVEPSFDFVNFFISILVTWVLMIAALKLTCKYWGVDVEWKGLMIAAAADTGVRLVVGIIGGLLGMMSLFYADHAAAAIVLVLVLRKVSTNQSLQQAVTITMTSKVFSIVVGSFVSVFIMHSLNSLR